MIREPIKVYVTRYAATACVFTQDVVETTMPTMVQVTANGLRGRFLAPTYYHKPDWHLTEQEARADWERRITKAIAAAERKIKKLKAIDPWAAEIDNKGEDKSDGD